jgi:hypothetical protein
LGMFNCRIEADEPIDPLAELRTIVPAPETIDEKLVVPAISPPTPSMNVPELVTLIEFTANVMPPFGVFSATVFADTVTPDGIKITGNTEEDAANAKVPLTELAALLNAAFDNVSVPADSLLMNTLPFIALALNVEASIENAELVVPMLPLVDLTRTVFARILVALVFSEVLEAFVAIIWYVPPGAVLAILALGIVKQQDRMAGFITLMLLVLVALMYTEPSGAVAEKLATDILNGATDVPMDPPVELRTTEDAPETLLMAEEVISPAVPSITVPEFVIVIVPRIESPPLLALSATVLPEAFTPAAIVIAGVAAALLISAKIPVVDLVVFVREPEFCKVTA